MKSDEIAMEVIDVLTDLSVPYMVVGSLSSNYYGIARSTNDADIVVEFKDISPRQIAARLGAEFRLQPQATFETITSTTRYVIDVIDVPFKIELFSLSDDPHDQERFRRRVRHQIHHREVYLPTPEDVIITKIYWAQSRGERGKDAEDVRSIMAMRAESLDLTYTHT